MPPELYAIVDDQLTPRPVQLQQLAAAAATLAKAHGARTTAIIFERSESELADQCAPYFGRVLVLNAQPRYFEERTDILVACMRELAATETLAGILISSDAKALDAAAALAGSFNLPLATDVQNLEVSGSELRLTLRKLGGGVVTTLRLPAATSLAICFSPIESAPLQSAAVAAPIEVHAPSQREASIELVASSLGEQDEISLDLADTIVSGGKALGGPEPFTGMLRELALELGAAVGASRAVVDAGWVSHALQIGQTGRTVSPKLYVAVGISGQIQHRVGMQTAGTIVAINSDAKAPIAQFSDLLVVGDLFAIVPALTKKLREEKVHT